ncbi:twin-arginine translocase subunit TatC [Ferviditalea candida]|uniref:twin-arginine translocase subunit TatC n=1 Tax=Ferviditalea candida TaxID=3108399 RepID=UPI00352D651B
MEINSMSLIDHLGELRKRIIWVLVVFVVMTIVGLIFAEPIINFLKNDAPVKGLEWNAFSPWDAIRIYMQFAFATAVAVTLPVLMYHVWAFVKPGLHASEQKATLMYIPFAMLLIVVGFLFSYFVVFPMAMLFTDLMTKRLQIKQTYGIAQYFTFMFNIIIPVSLLFELPIVVMFLTKIRILNPMRLHKLRRYAYVLLLIIGAIITPPDVVSAIIVTIPLIVLYEFSVFLSRIIYRKQLAADQAFEAEYGQTKMQPENKEVGTDASTAAGTEAGEGNEPNDSADEEKSE